jgi:hypothetical protein
MSSPALSITTGSNDARRLAAGEVVPSQEVASLEEVARRVEPETGRAHPCGPQCDIGAGVAQDRANHRSVL